MTGLLANTTLLLVFVLGACLVLGRRRAPLRNLIAVLGLGALAALPALSLALAWRRGVPDALAAPWSAPTAARWFLSSQPEDLARIAVLLWAAGAVIVLARLAIDRMVLGWHLRRNARPAVERCSNLAAELARGMGIRRRLRVLETDAFDIPCTWGVLRPVILLPRRAATWSEERMRVVLLHELGHVRRWDGLLTALGRAACALYWFHPLAWWIHRQAREDAETACDRLVLEDGVTPERYARHLLGIIRDSRSAHPVLAPGMATESHLSSRISALLDHPHAAGRIRRRVVLLAVGALLATTVVLTEISSPGVSEAGTLLTGMDCSEEPPVLESQPYDVLPSNPPVSVSLVE
jgi:beta-lactamase regulating signal transducer with metallopeptidase domain